jgi:hypothetical protein
MAFSFEVQNLECFSKPMDVGSKNMKRPNRPPHSALPPRVSTRMAAL